MDDDSHDLVVRTIREHAGALLRTAQRHSICADDAHDAYQRALEIFLRRAPSLEPDTVDRWLHVVVKHEAQAVRRARQRLVTSDEVDLDGRPAETLPDADERLIRFDRLSRSAEALQRLKPQEVTALWLKAQGLSYTEIAERQSWTYTKVNRCITEGRRAFLERYAGIETGEECRRWSPVLSALVDGEATAEQLAAARPHLRRCAACKATLRELHETGPRMAGVMPGIGLAGVGVAGLSAAGAGGGSGGGRFESLVRGAESAVAALQERAAAWAVKVQTVSEVAAGGKAAAVAASAAALAGGGAATIHEVARADRGPAAGEERAAARSREAGSGSAVARPVALGGGFGAPVAALRMRPDAGGGRPTRGAGAGAPGDRQGAPAARRAREFGGRGGRRGGGRDVREFRAVSSGARVSVAEFRAARSVGRAAGVAEFRTVGSSRVLSASPSGSSSSTSVTAGGTTGVASAGGSAGTTTRTGGGTRGGTRGEFGRSGPSGGEFGG